MNFCDNLPSEKSLLRVGGLQLLNSLLLTTSRDNAPRYVVRSARQEGETSER